jgi:hypothetical protein
VISLASAGTSHALLGDSDGAWGLDGSFRSLAAAVDNYDLPGLAGGEPHDADFLSQSILRLTLAGRPSPALSYEIHGIQIIDYATSGSASGLIPVDVSGLAGLSSFGGLAAGDTRYRALDATWDWHQGDHVQATLALDRAAVKLSVGPVDLTVGRQAITFGKAYFWSPLDVFLPFDPRQFDREYKPGVDALRVDLALGRFSGVTLVGAAGRRLDTFGRFATSGGREALDASWFGSAVLARAFTNFADWDFSLQAGKVYGGYQIGGGAVGEIGEVEVRLEVAQLFADDSRPLLEVPPGVTSPVAGEDQVEDATSLVLGLGHRFESSLTIETEYFHNGAGDSDNLDASLLRFAAGGLLDMSENLGGVVFSYEVLPIVTGYLGTIVSFDDGSVQIQPRVVWSAGDELEVQLGAIVHAGQRPGLDPMSGLPSIRSEFGTFPDVYYVQPQFYF